MTEIQENEELETVELEEDDSSYEVIEDDSDSDDPKSGDEELQSYTKEAKKRRSKEETERRIRQLTAARKTAEEEAAAAVQYIQQVQAQNEQMKTRLANLDKGYVNEYEGRVNAQEVQAKRALAEAYEAGDYDKVAEAQGAIAQIAIEKERLRNQKAKAARQAQQVPQQRQVQQQQPQGTPVRPQRDEKLESWMQKNPWFGPSGDKIMTSAARALHETLVNEEGYDPVADADDYYREIDRRMRQEMPHKFQGDKRVQSVTPASSTSRTVKSGRKRQVELTKGQVKLAKQLGIPLEKYAAEVAKLENRRD